MAHGKVVSVVSTHRNGDEPHIVVQTVGCFLDFILNIRLFRCTCIAKKVPFVY
jgi:hypothetical protein